MTTRHTGHGLVLALDGGQLVSRLVQLSSHVDQILRRRLSVVMDAIQGRLKVSSFVLPFFAQLLRLLLFLLQLRVGYAVLQKSEQKFPG